MGVTVIEPKGRGGFVYEVIVYTGMLASSGTTANVSIVMIGENGESGVIPLVNLNCKTDK